MRTIALEDRTLGRVTVESPIDGIIGAGRDANLSSAMSRAYGEVIERLVTREVLLNDDALDGHAIRVSGSTIEFGSRQTVGLPPPALRTSNGWAVHFDAESAIRGAVAEVLERHLLLYSFFKSGWDGFASVGGGRILERDVFYLEPKYRLGGHRALMALARMTEHPGFTTGYACSSVADDLRLKAALEAVEPAIRHDLEPELVGRQARSPDPIERTQAHYLVEPFPALRPKESEPVNLGDTVDLRVAVVDVQKAWSLPFPFHAAFVTGDAMIPLFFEAKVKECPKSRAHVDALMNLHALERPDVHPII